MRILLLIFLLFNHSGFATCNKFADKISNLNISEQTKKDFLKLQGELTLHRLAWAHLKILKQENKLKQNIEESILSLLREKFDNPDDEFKSVVNLFEKQSKSRNALSKIAPYLKQILEKMNPKEEDQLFILNASDLYYLDLLAEQETKNSDGTYNEKMSQTGILNLLTIISSSYTGQTKNAEWIDFNLMGLQRKMDQLSRKKNELIDSLSLNEKCIEEDHGCENDRSIVNLKQQADELSNLLVSHLKEDLKNDSHLKSSIRYGSIWLSTYHRPKGSKTMPSTAPQREKTKANSKTQLPKKSENLLSEKEKYHISDPINVIVKDKTGRKPENWKSFDAEFLQKFSQSIVNNDEAFMVRGKLFSRHTGKNIPVDPMIKLYEIDFSKLPNQEAEFKTNYILANLNKKKGFVYKDELYDHHGKKMDPIHIIVKERERVLHVKRTPAQYSGFDKHYLSSLALAIKENQPSFVHAGIVHDTSTGFQMHSPNNKLTKNEIDYKGLRTERGKLNILDDEDIVVNFHREYKNTSNGCDRYTVINKKENKLRIYNLAGDIIFESEVLLGSQKSDKRTIFTDYTFKTSNHSTGAGIYQLGEQKKNHPYYKEVFNDNLFTIINPHTSKEEAVLAIHQIPNKMKQRYSYLGNEDQEDNRVTGGCINLKESDFVKFKSNVGQGCPFYVLPEEEGNRFIVKNKKLNFTTDNKITGEDLNNYHFNPKKEYRPIKLFTTDKELSQSPIVKTYLQTLESEKEKMMKVFSLDNDDYNDLAQVAFGILGNESSFGKEEPVTFAAMEYFGINPSTMNPMALSLTIVGGVMLTDGVTTSKLKIKESNQWAIDFIKWCKGNDSTNSRGLTQIKQLDPSITNNFPEINLDNLTNPRNAAIATMGYLAQALKELKAKREKNIQTGSGPQFSRDEMIDYIGFIYQGRAKSLSSATNPANPDKSKYITNLKNHISKLEITEKQ